MHPMIKTAHSVFDDIKKKIILYYVGDIAKLRLQIPEQKATEIYGSKHDRESNSMPLTANGKINRVVEGNV